MAEYIKRTDALRIIDEVYGAENVYHRVRNIPAADVVPVIHGTWNLLRHDRHSDVFQCSKCGRKVSLTHGWDVLEQFPYCHCGAKMEVDHAEA